MKANEEVEAFLGLGSSLGNRLMNMRMALERLRDQTVVNIEAVSPFYESPHMGLQPGDELRYPPHLNCVAKIRTNLAPEELLTVIQSVEDAGARQRTERWGPRTIDMDILLYGHETRDTEILTIPHSGLTERAFVVIPLLDIAPELILPDGVPLRDVAAQDTIQRQPLKRVEDDELLL